MYHDFQQVERNVKFAPTASFRSLNTTAQETFHKLWQRRQRIRSLRIVSVHTLPQAPQISLFSTKDDRFERIQLAGDRLAIKYGHQLVQVAQWT
ncbi:MAG: hypothetical protein AAGI38_10840 [Bacteroidota bacterium]